MALYASSTQRKHWLLSADTISSTRQSLNDNVPPSLDPINNPYPKLTLEDEELLRLHFESIIIGTLNKSSLGLPNLNQVTATALIYFKRVYLQCSIMDRIPLDVIPAVIFLALKVEEVKMNVDDFSRIFHYRREMVLEFEFAIMSLIKHHLLVHLPFRSLSGFLAEFVELKFLNQDDVESVELGATKILHKMCFGDVLLMFTPSQIALSSIRMVVGNEVVDKFLVSRRLQAELFSSKIFDKIDKIVRHNMGLVQTLSTDLVGTLMQKLIKCRNPWFDRESEMYKEGLKKLQQQRFEMEQKRALEVKSKIQSDYESLMGIPHSGVIDVVAFDDSP
ncbi:hypothetical protein GEMRC1_000014 [Eukaryota sp. GEM-RC1]